MLIINLRAVFNISYLECTPNKWMWCVSLEICSNWPIKK